MAFAYKQIPSDQIRNIPGENNFRSITPYFMHVNLKDDIQSEIQGKEVFQMHEVVQLRFAGDRYYSPVMPVDSMYRKIGNNVITYAERWAEQYRQFLANEDQIAEGTPLDNLTNYGITPAQLSLCRALKIYSIEALYHLEGSNLKSLGVHANDLKPMARKFMEDRQSGANQLSRIAELEAKIAALQSGVVVKEDMPEDEADEAIELADIEAMSVEELRAIIVEKTMTKPDMRLGHAALVNLVKGM